MTLFCNHGAYQCELHPMEKQLKCVQLKYYFSTGKSNISLQFYFAEGSILFSFIYYMFPFLALGYHILCFVNQKKLYFHKAGISILLVWWNAHKTRNCCKLSYVLPYD